MEKRLLVSNGKCSRLIDQKNVLFFYMEQGKVTVFFCEEGIIYKFAFYHSMKDIEERLSKGSFIRIHRNYLVSLDHIVMIDRQWVTIDDKNSTKLPVGRTYAEKLKNALCKDQNRIIAL